MSTAPEQRAKASRRPVAMAVGLALMAAAGAAATWVGLALATGLIFHLMPVAPALAAAAAYRAVRPAGRPSPGTQALVLVPALALSCAAAMLLARAGSPLDAPALTVAAIAAGAMGGAWWLNHYRV